MRFKRKKKFNNVYVIIIIIFLYTSWMMEYIDKKSDDILVRSVQLLVKKDLYKDIYSNINEIFINEDVDNIININKNSNNEIMSIDYRLGNCYKLLNKYIDNVYDTIVSTDYSDTYYNDGVYFVSSSLINDVLLFNSIGIKIPTKVNVLNDVRVNYKTSVKNYGINSVLVELYLVINVNSWFVNPFNDGVFGEKYEYVISSKIINGKIPEYFGNVIEKESSIVSS